MMYDPTYIVLNTRFLMLIMNSDADTPKRYVPVGQWVNPLRYSVTFYPGDAARYRTINDKGRANTAIRNLIFRIKRKLGIWKPPTRRPRF